MLNTEMQELRQQVLEIVRHGIRAVDPFESVLRAVSVHEGQLEQLNV